MIYRDAHAEIVHSITGHAQVAMDIERLVLSIDQAPLDIPEVVGATKPLEGDGPLVDTLAIDFRNRQWHGVSV